jgi:signal transduction histidine kinase
VAQTLTSLLAPGDITTMILDQLRRVVPYATAALMLRDGNQMRITATRGFADPIRSRIEQMRFSLDNDPNLAQIVRTRQPLVVEDAQAEAAFIPIKGSEHIHGWIGAPLLLDDEVIGLLTVDSSTVGAYTHEDAQLAFALASLAAQAIRNSRLFDEVNRFAVQLEQRVVERTAELADTNAQLSTEKERLQAVHAITLELAQNLDMEATLTKALELVSRAVGTRHGSILLRDLATGRLICRARLAGDNAVQATNAPISADVGHIGQIIQALLSNAIKFSYPGGIIMVRARQIEHNIQIDIADTGVGIAPEQQLALFRRFYRADNPLRGELGGAGLGLAITKALVELYGGTIWVSSAAGQGSTFSVALPISVPGIDSSV